MVDMSMNYVSAVAEPRLWLTGPSHDRYYSHLAHLIRKFTEYANDRVLLRG